MLEEHARSLLTTDLSFAEGHTEVPPLIYSFAFHGFSYSQATMVQKQMIFLLTYHQKVSSSLVLGHNVCVIPLTSSQRMGILSAHTTTRRVRTVQ